MLSVWWGGKKTIASWSLLSSVTLSTAASVHTSVDFRIPSPSEVGKCDVVGGGCSIVKMSHGAPHADWQVADQEDLGPHVVLSYKWKWMNQVHVYHPPLIIPWRQTFYCELGREGCVIRRPPSWLALSALTVCRHGHVPLGESGRLCPPAPFTHQNILRHHLSKFTFQDTQI